MALPIALILGKAALQISARAGMAGARGLGRMAGKLKKVATGRLAAGGAGGGLASVASKLLGGRNNQDDNAENISKDIGTEKPIAAPMAIPSVVTTGTDSAIVDFAKSVSKESKVAYKEHQSEKSNSRLAPPQQLSAPPVITKIESIEPRQATEKPISLAPPQQLSGDDYTINAIRGIGSAANVLEKDAKDNLDKQRQYELNRKREEEEQQLEGSGVFSKIGGKLSEYGSNLKNGILAALTPFVAPALLFAGSFAVEKLGLGKDGEEVDVEEVLETTRNSMERITQAATQGAMRTTAAGLVRGGSTIAAAAGQGSSAAAGQRAATLIAGQVNPVNAKYKKYLANIRNARAWLYRLSKSSSGIVSKASAWLANLPKSIRSVLGKAAKRIVRWVIILEIFDAIYNSTQALVLNSITKEEWHKRNKEQIYKLVRLFGAPVLGMMILGLAGSPVPVLGNIVGTLAGFIIGVILGESLFYIVNMEAAVSALYDAFVLGKWSSLAGYGPALIKRIAIELPKLLASAAASVLKKLTVSPLKIAADFVTSDRMATTEEIKTKYGENIDSAELLFKAGEGLGTDENAILYAFKDINTPEKYTTFKKEFEEKYIPEYNKGVMFDVDTMEEYLQKELGRGEYNQLKTQIAQQMKQNSNNEASQLSEFFKDVGIEETPTIAGIGEVSDEEYAKYQAGELIDVVTKDGEKVLMTEQELRESENVAQPFKENAIRQMQGRRRQTAYESVETPTTSEETPIENNVNDNRFVFSNVKYSKLDDETELQINKRRTELERQYREEETAKYIENNGKEPRGSWRDHIRTIARMRAEKAIQQEFRDQIIAADAGTLATETPRQSERPAEGSQDNITPEKERQVVADMSDIIKQNIVPKLGKVTGNIAVLNQSVLQQQKTRGKRVGTEGPSYTTSATPTRRTNDAFIDVGHFT